MDRRGFLDGAIAGATAFAGVKSEETRGELKQAQYAIVELMGYKKLVGKLSQGIAGLLQLDVPVEGGFITQMFNPASVYRITFVDGQTVASLASRIDPLPTIELEIQPRQASLFYGGTSDFDDERPQ